MCCRWLCRVVAPWTFTRPWFSATRTCSLSPAPHLRDTPPPPPPSPTPDAPSFVLCSAAFEAVGGDKEHDEAELFPLAPLAQTPPIRLSALTLPLLVLVVFVFKLAALLLLVMGLLLFTPAPLLLLLLAPLLLLLLFLLQVSLALSSARCFVNALA